MDKSIGELHICPHLFSQHHDLYKTSHLETLTSIQIYDFLKNAFNKGEKPKLSFYKDKTGKEIDLITETINGLNLLQIKACSGHKSNYFKNIRYFENFPRQNFILFNNL